MTNPLDGAWAKLARADEHLDTLNKEIERAYKPHAYRPFLEIRQDGDWYVVVTKPIPITRPVIWSAICGDAVQNLRAALDYVVCELVRATGKQPTRRNAFPIETDPRRYHNRVVAPKCARDSPLYGLDPKGEPWAIIERAQPFHARDPDFDALAILARLSNWDKHQSLYVQMAFPTDLDPVRWNPTAVLLDRIESNGPISFEERTELVRLRFAASSPEPNVHVEGRLLLLPSFGDEDAQLSLGGFRTLLLPRVNGVLGDLDRF